MKHKKVDELNYFELLNLPNGANSEQIHQAYLQLTSVYSYGSTAIYGAISDKEREWILKNIQEAYETLVHNDTRGEYIRHSPRIDNENISLPPPGVVNKPYQADFDNTDIDHTKNSSGAGIGASPDILAKSRITGSHLRNIRLARGTTLEEIANQTKIKKSYLEAIEQDDFKSFAEPVFMKGFIKSYAKALRLDANEICEKYLARE